MLSRLEWELEQRKQYVACPVLIPFNFFAPNIKSYSLMPCSIILYAHTHTLPTSHTLHRLAEQHGDLEKNIGEQQTDISKMEDNLSSLQPTLENIRKATLPLQESLGLPLDKRRTENEMAHLLPPWVIIEKIMWLGNFFLLSSRPLYIFFMQIRTYADVQGMHVGSCYNICL